MLQRAFNTRPSATDTQAFPAPTKGWVQSGNVVMAGRDQAEVLDNFIPTAQGARLRGGSSQYANLETSVIRLFSYSGGGAVDFFGSTETGIYDVDRASTVVTADALKVEAGAVDLEAEAGGAILPEGATTQFQDVEGLSSGDWSVVQTSTAGGEFLWMVNGSDLALYWDGTEWNPINDAAVNEVPFDAETTAFAVGETVTGGTSGASATILAITKTSATEGALKVGAITSGPFQDNEALTSTSGAATAAGASASASTVTISGVATTNLSQAWLFKERIFAVEKNSQSAWYLPVESIGGTATEINLGSIFRRGGDLLFGATWSLDSGAGLDDVCLFVSVNGEIAVYEGTDPSSASTWALVGVYDIGKPLNKHGFFKAGGDLAILTEDGIIPVSEALRKDRAALQAVAITYPIEDAWKDAIANRTITYPISVSLWQSQTILLIGTPQQVNNTPVSFIANARTGAWARVTGWDVRCSTVVNDQLYFGTDDGLVLRADVGGNDNGVQYTGVYVPKFADSNVWRSANAAQLTYRAPYEVDFSMAAHANYQVDPIVAPASTQSVGTDVWGTGVWGTFVWGAGAPTNTYRQWQTVRAGGEALAPSVAITSNQPDALSFEVLVTRLRFESGYAL